MIKHLKNCFMIFLVLVLMNSLITLKATPIEVTDEVEQKKVQIMNGISPGYVEEVSIYTVDNASDSKEINMQSISSGEFLYKIINGTYASIVGYTGENAEITIPDSIDEYIVQAIGKFAFKDNTFIRKINIPETIELIDLEAFSGCLNLTTIVFSKNTTKISEKAFYGCTNLTEINLPSQLEEISAYAFSGCTGITALELPDTVTTIGYRAFENCTSLVSVNYPMSWSVCSPPPEYSSSYYGNCGDIFAGCNSLTSIAVPEGITTIPDYAFSGFTYLQTVSLPSTLQTIGEYAFYNCTGFSSFAFPDNIKEIKRSAFEGCATLSTPNFPNELEIIGAYAFSGCTGITTLELPDTITTIGYRAFENCTGLVNVNYPMSWSVCSPLPGYSSSYYWNCGDIFAGCTSLTSIAVPEGITTLPDYAFSGCTYLQTVSLPSTLQTIGDYAFYNCTGFSSFIVPSTVTKIGDGAFQNCEGLTSVSLSYGLKSIGESAFLGCSGFTLLSLPDSITTIGYQAFKDCVNLTSINYPLSLTSCGTDYNSGSIFMGCTKLLSVTVPEGVTYIPAKTFKDCIYFRTIILPESVTSIGDYAFDGCYGLLTIILPSRLHTIGKYAFSECGELLFIRLSNTVKQIGDYAFYKCVKLKTIDLSENLQTIGKNAFYNCSALANVRLTPKITAIGAYAFYGTGIETLVVPAGITTINDFTFANCVKLKDITFHRTVKTISDTVFNQSPSTTIFCYSGSEAHTYALNSYMPYNLLFEESPNGSEVDNTAILLSGTTSSGIEVSLKVLLHEYDSLSKISEADVSLTAGTLEIKKDGYNPVNIPNSSLYLNNQTTCTIVSCAIVPLTTESYIAAVHCEGKDALMKNLKIDNERTSLSINVYSNLDSSEIDCFQLMQDLSIIATSKTGIFIVDPSKLTVDKALSVRVVKFDGTICKKIKTNIIVADERFLFNRDITFADRIEFAIPSNVPLIGGREVSIDFSLVPIAFEKEGDTFRIGIGCKKDLLKNENSWLNFKKFIEKQDDNLRKGLNAYFSTAFGRVKAIEHECDMEVYGYVEGSLDNLGNFHRVGGRIMIEITGKVDYEWQFVVVVVPVVGKITGEAAGEFTVSLGFDLEKAKLYTEAEITLTLPKLTLSAGVGVAYIADVSLYGSGDNKIKYNTKTDSTTATLSGEFGASVKMLFASYKMPIHKGSLQYNNSGQAQTSSMELLDINAVTRKSWEINNYSVDRSYAYDQSYWLGTSADNDEPTSEDEEKLITLLNDVSNLGEYSSAMLQTNVFYSAKPQIVITDNGVKMMVWTADIKNRPTGNHTAVVYSIYDEISMTWSEPVIIDDDGTADFEPSLATKGDDIYIVWMDSKNNNFTGDSTLAEIAASCEICVAVYNSVSKSFSVSTLTDNVYIDMKPAITIVNDSAYIAWVSNYNNDILSSTGENTVHIAVGSNSSWIVSSYSSAKDRAILSLAVGEINSSPYIAYSLDGDGDLTTTNDIEIMCGDITNSALPITSNNIYEQSVQFAKINNTNILTWYANGLIYYTEDLKTVLPLTTESQFGISPYYKLLDCGINSTLLSVSNSSKGTSIYAYTISGTKISSPVEITRESAYITAYAPMYNNGLIYTVYTNTSAEISADTIIENTNLHISSMSSFHDISVNSISYDLNDVTGGESIPVHISVTNNGLANEEKLTIVAKSGNCTVSNTSVEVNLPTGESVDIVTYLMLPTVISPETIFAFTVYPDAGTDINSSDNTKEITVGYVDLSLKVDNIASKSNNIALITIDNTSCIEATATLYVRERNSTGAVLKSYYISSIGANSTEIFSLELNDIHNNDPIWYFEVFTVEPELFSADNSGYIYIEDTLPKLKANISVNGKLYDFDTESAGDCMAIIALYDVNGRMLAVKTEQRKSSESEIFSDFDISGLQPEYTVKLFLVDGNLAPLTAAFSQESY
ncbi:MAG: leucine-rich repeat domain-containing protein [Herbinix sp.]|nr:leucine-rich repeat domain-containing protein [Herbinix sp.]